MNFRTDLAVEIKENIEEENLKGIKSEVTKRGEVTITSISVLDERGEKLIGKPVGKYITLEIGSFLKNSELLSHKLTCLKDELQRLLPSEGTVLVVGLGNEKITPDSLGPKVSSLILATRHLSDEFAKSIGFHSLRSVASVVPGVLGSTGIESAETVMSLAKRLKPSAVIAVDALCARDAERLGTTIQLTNSGISPGSGVGNKRSELSEETLGVPVIGIGVPTVVDEETLVFDLLSKNGLGENKIEEILSCQEKKDILMVTPKEVDNMIERAAMLIAMGINCALQPEIPPEDILAIVS